MLVQNATQNTQFLDWRDRPEGVKSNIESSLVRLQKNIKSSWGVYNGSPKYEMCSVNEHALIERLIKEAPTRKDFYFLDIGAGNFQWGKSLADFLSKLEGIPENVTFHIVSLRGETYTGEKEETLGQCKLYNFGAFKIEEIEDELEKFKLPLHLRVDFAVSRWCFRHFVDPVGTFGQVYNLLRENGILAIDGFYFESKKNVWPNSEMIGLFLDTEAPFLVQNFDGNRSLNRFLLKKPDQFDCQLPLQYEGRKSAWDFDIGSRTILQFQRTKEKKSFGFNYSKNHTLFGDRDFYTWLKNHHLFSTHQKWRPLDQEVQIDDSLHLAIQEQDIHDFKETLARKGHLINESLKNGNTPLHEAILHNRPEHFKSLLEWGADPFLHNDEKKMPIHLAATLDHGTPFIQALQDHGVPLHLQSDGYQTPIEVAIRNKQKNTILFLFENGVQPPTKRVMVRKLEALGIKC